MALIGGNRHTSNIAPRTTINIVDKLFGGPPWRPLSSVSVAVWTTLSCTVDMVRAARRSAPAQPEHWGWALRMARGPEARRRGYPTSPTTSAAGVQPADVWNLHLMRLMSPRNHRGESFAPPAVYDHQLSPVPTPRAHYTFTMVRSPINRGEGVTTTTTTQQISPYFKPTYTRTGGIVACCVCVSCCC